MAVLPSLAESFSRKNNLALTKQNLLFHPGSICMEQRFRQSKENFSI